MAEIIVRLNVEKLKDYDMFFYGKWLNAQKVNEWAERKVDLTDYEVILNLTYENQDFDYFKQLIDEFPLMNDKPFNFDELITWAFITKHNLEEAELHLQFARQRKSYLSTLKELLTFKEAITKDTELSIRISNNSVKTGPRSSSYITIPSKNHLDKKYWGNKIALKVLVNAIKEATEQVCEFGNWLTADNVSIEEIEKVINCLPKLEENPSDAFKLAFAIESILNYLRGEEYSNYSGEYFGNDEAIFIRNFLTIFKFIPGERRIKDQKLNLTTDLNFNNNLRYSLEQIRSLPK